MTQLNYYTFSQFQKEQEDKYYAAKKMIEKIKISVDKLCSFYSSSLLYI